MLKHSWIFVLGFLASSVSMADRPAVHGMLIFGKGKVYLSHLPMFHNPHDYQLIVEATLTIEAQRRFAEDQAANPEQRVYTLVPESFVLPDMVARPRAFHAAIVRGHFERPGNVTLIEDTVVSFSRVIYFKKLVPITPRPRAAAYLFFGTAGDIYGAHLITERGNFDHIVSIHLADVPTIEELKSKPFVARSFPVASDLAPLEEGFGDQGIAFVRNLYLEFGDLQ